MDDIHYDHPSEISSETVLEIHKAYAQFSYKPQHSQWTILASFFLARSTHEKDTVTKIISLATGTKCLPLNRLSPRGESIHDSHAEVLARRCAVRWMLEEIRRIQSFPDFESEWIVRRPVDGRYQLRPEVDLNLYVSTVPCGDASMRFLASAQDAAMAALKSTSVFPALAPTAASRGRDDYARLGVLRTKPGRADSPATRCMSCSDKIARWAVLGVQGALGARVLAPVYLRRVIIGEVPQADQAVVRADCARALGGRLVGASAFVAHGEFALHSPEICFTDIAFAHSRTVLNSSTSCNESLCWIAECTPASTPEILINGLKRGVSPKHRYREKSRPLVSRISLLCLFRELFEHSSDSINGTVPDINTKGACNLTSTYLDVKLASAEYQTARARLVGYGGAFSGWLATGPEWQKFNCNGEVKEDVDVEESVA